MTMPDAVTDFLRSPTGNQLVASAVVVILAVALRSLFARVLRRNDRLSPPDRLRWQAHARTLTFAVALLGLLFIWGSELREFMVSLVVFASALVLGTKELLMCFTGSLLGALVLRAIMIGGGLWLISMFEWILFVFGAYLAFTGFRLLFAGTESEEDAQSSRIVRLAKRILRIAPGDHGDRFIVEVDGRRRFTNLALVLLVIEWSDVVFAVDSIPAVLAVSHEPFIVFTSNTFAILGLRSLYFVLADAIDRFEHLKYGLALILIFIGAKMLAHDVVHVPNTLSLVVVAGVLACSIGVSLWRSRDRTEPPESA